MTGPYNNFVQATPVCAILFFLNQVPGVPAAIDIAPGAVYCVSDRQ